MTSAAPTIAAIVPMRHFSRRVSGKNYRRLGEKPLYRHILDTLIAVPLITEVVVDTDSPVIMDELARSLPEVRLVLRPEKLRGEMLVANEILLNTVRQVDADIYLQTHSTNPFLTTATLSTALTTFVSQRERYDSLFSATPRQVRLWTADGRAINHNPDRLIRTQDLVPVLEENSCIYIFTRAVLEARRNRIGARPLVFETDGMEVFDIDTEADWKMAEALLDVKERWKPSV